MNNDLEQFSEERLQDIVEFRAKPTPLDGVLLSRIALSAKQAKPELWRRRRKESKEWKYLDREFGSGEFMEEQPLYTTPQPAHTEQDGWIKCDDSLPEDDTLCVAIDSEGVIWTMLFEDDDFYPDTGGVCPNEITHWMPLPNPPAAPKPESK